MMGYSVRDATSEPVAAVDHLTIVRIHLSPDGIASLPAQRRPGMKRKRFTQGQALGALHWSLIQGAYSRGAKCREEGDLGAIPTKAPRGRGTLRLTPEGRRLNRSSVAGSNVSRRREENAMKLVRWDPLQGLVAMTDQLNRTVDDSYTPRTEDAIGAWAPPVDIFETQDHVVIRAEVPGVQKEDMDLRIESGVLTLHGERKQDTDVKEEGTLLMERVCGEFTRCFSLPTTFDTANITATYEDGVLEVTVPKAETAKPKTVEIKAA
jgi:HSP20 family protein